MSKLSKTVINTPDGKIEKRNAAKDHLLSQIKYPSNVAKNKKKYTRKEKHSNKNFEKY